MFAYNPAIQDRSGEIIAEASNNAANIQAQSMMDFGQTIGGAISSLAGMYSDRKMMEAKASSYDDIGKILQGGMFSNNPQASEAFSNIAKQKDPYKKVLAYEGLFDLLGPISNAQMAQNRFGYSSSLANQQTAARNQVPANQAVPNQSAAMDVQGWAGRLKENR